jgi:hypothetical protein
MTDPAPDRFGRTLTPEVIAHLRELDAARTQGEAVLRGGGEYLLPFGIMVAPDDGGITDADAEWILAAANYMGALLDVVERAPWFAEYRRAAIESSRLRAELTKAQAVADDLAEHGLRFDLNPTMLSESPMNWLTYIARMDAHAKEIGAVLRTALATTTQHEEDERD